MRKFCGERKAEEEINATVHHKQPQSTNPWIELVSDTNANRIPPKNESKEEAPENPLHKVDDKWNQVDVTTRCVVSCKGYLKRRVFFGSWEKHYFLLAGDKLFEFESKSNEKPLVVYALNLCSVCSGDGMMDKEHLIFLNGDGKSPLLFQAPNKSIMVMWMDAMNLVSMMVDNPGKSIQSSNCPTIISDRKGIILDLNQAVNSLFGYTREELMGEKITLLMLDSVARNHNQHMKNHFITEERKLMGKHRNFTAKHKLEYEIPIALVIGEFIDKGNWHFIAIFKDQRKLELDPALNTPDIANSYVRAVAEIELENHLPTYRETRKDFEKETHKCKQKLKLLRKNEKKLNLKIFELQKLIIAAKSENDTGAGNCLSKIPKKEEISKKGVFIDFSKVTIIERINDGCGVGADIYQCNVDGFQCAMKTISTTNCDDRKLKHLLSEIEILESLPPHPNICQYLFHDIQGDRVRLFITQYSGSLHWTIEEFQTSERVFKAKEIAEISVNILNALIFLHKRGLVHRDLKSDNIFCMLNENNDIVSVSLDDFDSAKNLEISKGKTIIGSLGFTAPEILRASPQSEYDEKVDIFSFGMVLYELLSLEMPYYDIGSVSEISQYILNGVKPKLPLLSPDYKVLVDLHELCINHDPTKRISPIDAKKILLRTYW